jgi:potassium channel family protein
MARTTLFQIIEPHQKENAIEKAYDVFMFLTIIVSLISLTTKSHTGIFMWLDFVSTIIFVIDYLLRLLTADYKLEKGKLSFLLYPFTFLALGYIFISALIIFNVEPSTFPNFFDALYWATISLTTVGYGDIYAVSTTGKIITMISSFLGIAIDALPAGIITAGYMKEIKEL